MSTELQGLPVPQEESSYGKVAWTAFKTVFFAHALAGLISYGLVYTPEDQKNFGTDTMVTAIQVGTAYVSAIFNIGVFIALVASSKTPGDRKWKQAGLYFVVALIEYGVLSWATGAVVRGVIS